MLDVAGPAEAAVILGVPRRHARLMAGRLGVPYRDLKSMRVWRASTLEKAAYLKRGEFLAGEELPPDVVGRFEATDLIRSWRPTMRANNLRKFLEGRGVWATELEAGPVWDREEIIRLGSLAALRRQSRSSKCQKGLHEMTVENTIVRASGVAHCRACQEESRRRYRERMLAFPCPRCGVGAGVACVSQATGRVTSRPHDERTRWRAEGAAQPERGPRERPSREVSPFDRMVEGAGR